MPKIESKQIKWIINEMTLPFFSVVTVTLNPGDDLLPTVQSCLNQKNASFELLIKDGGSTDGSLEKLPEDDRIKIIQSEDKGIYDSMNQALVHCKGRFVQFLNAGDQLASEHILYEVEKNIRKNHEAQFFYGNVVKPASRSGYVFYPEKISKYFLFTRPICHQSWFLARSCYLLHPFDTRFVRSADHQLLLRLIINSAIPYVHIRKNVVIYKGDGFSEKILSDSDVEDLWNKEKKKYFSSVERCIYLSLFQMRTFLKYLFYDSFMFLFWKQFLTIQFKISDDTK